MFPRIKGATFETAIIERYRRRQSSVEEALIEMKLAGVSVRRVEDITEAPWGNKPFMLKKAEPPLKQKHGVAALREMKLSEAAKKIEDGLEETLAYMDFLYEYWTRIRTNNVIEHLNREIRHRTRVVGPSQTAIPPSCLSATASCCRHTVGQQAVGWFPFFKALFIFAKNS